MSSDWNRRDFLHLLGVGGVVFASGGVGCVSNNTMSAPAAGGAGASAANDNFFFLQLSDTHWGYAGPSKPHADVTLERAVAAVNSADVQPDFIVFTGDLTHNTDDVTQRQDRMKRMREIAATLKVKSLYFLPGEHDAES